MKPTTTTTSTTSLGTQSKSKMNSGSIKLIKHLESKKNNIIPILPMNTDFQNTNNTKTTEEEDSEFDDYELYLRSRHHRRYHNSNSRQNNIDTNESDTNFSDSQTGSIPSLSTTNSIAVISSNYVTDSKTNQQTYETDNIYDDYEYDDFDTEDTEDTEDNSNFVFNNYRRSIKMNRNSQLSNKVYHVQQIQQHRSRHHSNSKYLQTKHKALHFNQRHYHQQQQQRNRQRSSNSRNSNSLTKRSTSKAKRNTSRTKPTSPNSQIKLSKLSKMQIFPPPILTSTLQFQQYNENLRNESIESDLDEIEPPKNYKNIAKIKNANIITKNHLIRNQEYIGSDLRYQTPTLIKRQSMITNHFKHIENFYKQTSASLLPASVTAIPDTSDKFSVDSASSTFSSQNENLQPKPYLVRQHTSKIANIKQFNNNHFSNNPTNKSLVPQLNVNDLYAILEPVIKPHIYDPKISQMSVKKFDLAYLGSVLIPYDTLSNACQLNRIRSSIEYYMLQNSNEHKINTSDEANFLENSNVYLEIFSDNIRLTSLIKQSSMVYTNHEIGFCGKVKDQKQFFALVILKENKTALNENIGEQFVNINTFLKYDNSLKIFNF